MCVPPLSLTQSKKKDIMPSFEDEKICGFTAKKENRETGNKSNRTTMRPLGIYLIGISI